MSRGKLKQAQRKKRRAKLGHVVIEWTDGPELAGLPMSEFFGPCPREDFEDGLDDGLDTVPSQ